ncbi:MAG: hypothetical protein Q4F82_09920 [bacterium]|nr:hypothetical protein [bacterium]
MKDLADQWFAYYQRTSFLQCDPCNDTACSLTTAKYQEGIYFIRTSNGNTQRLVIVHK